MDNFWNELTLQQPSGKSHAQTTWKPPDRSKVSHCLFATHSSRKDRPHCGCWLIPYRTTFYHMGGTQQGCDRRIRKYSYMMMRWLVWSVPCDSLYHYPHGAIPDVLKLLFFYLASPVFILDIDSSSSFSFPSNTTYNSTCTGPIYEYLFIFSSTMSKLKWMLDKATVPHDPSLTNAELMLTNDDLRPGENHYWSWTGRSRVAVTLLLSFTFDINMKMGMNHAS